MSTEPGPKSVAAWTAGLDFSIFLSSRCLVLTVEVLVESLLAGAERATGCVAIIDVFRAFTTAAVALANGASQIIMVGTVEEALRLRSNGAAQVCMGEVRGRKPAAFDFGNSPFELLSAALRGVTVIQRTSAGTQGIIAAAHRADRIYAASLVTADATARALCSGQPDRITLVAMGNMAQCAQTRTSCALCTCETYLKGGQATQKPSAA